ncbi:hypothetical protein E8E12_007617 [Didymella heteroderae]|uniref:FAD-binding domain-containing protein n=1 Tax=Didymella heteroderae TaxID=1769908 RepID=A0A9P4WX84_9PLEO|nr:hypothetical protein E8E12_007617 [Didymella heteroderae]
MSNGETTTPHEHAGSWPPKPLNNDAKDVQFGDFDHADVPLEAEEWPVIIIGSSMVGMMTGLLLGYHGIKSISFDRHPPSDTHPRAAGLNYRTSEILRQLGLEQLARDQSAKEFDIDAGMLLVEKLVGGKTLAHLQENDPKEVADVTPCTWLWITQAMFEPLLRANGPKFGCTQVYGKLVVHYEEYKDGVIVVVQDNKSKEFKKYRSKYLVACDGNRSSTRRKEDIRFDGVGTLRNSLSIRVAGNLIPYLGTRSVYGVIYVNNPEVNGGFRLENQGQDGIAMINRAGGRTDFPEGSVTLEQARQYVQSLSGLPDDAHLEVKSISYWTMTSNVADRLQSHGGRVFIAGDAGHTMPPTGGLGGNTGIGDAHNLAWKLAFVLKGQAHPTLLDTYTVERQPVNAFTVEQATARFYNRIDHVQPPASEEANLTVELGYAYPKGAVIHGGGTQFGRAFENPSSPSASAGTRFPHVFVKHGDKFVSTLDLVKQNLVIVATEPGSPWIQAAQAVTAPNIDAYELHESSSPIRDSEGILRQKCKLASGDALLVRPDGFIVWRAETRRGRSHLDALNDTLSRIFGSRDAPL